MQFFTNISYVWETTADTTGDSDREGIILVVPTIPKNLENPGHKINKFLHLDLVLIDVPESAAKLCGARLYWDNHTWVITNVVGSHKHNKKELYIRRLRKRKKSLKYPHEFGSERYE